MPPDPFISAQGLEKTYQEGSTRLQVLAGVDFQVEKGECVALLGRSGSGKSTLLNLLAGIDSPDRGEIFIGERDLKRLPEGERTLFRRQHIGFVYQFFNLIPTLSVAENIALPLELNGWNDGRSRARVKELLLAMDLPERADTFPDNLSGGEQQRVAIARALAQAPALVLADEPTGNLDAETGRRVLQLLLDMSRSAGHTLVIVTHSREVARLSDRQLLLEDGRLVQTDTALTW